jgi:hypothetical protein
MQAKTNIIQFNASKVEIDYNITNQAISELRTKYAALKASDKVSYKAVTQALSEVRSYRTGVEKKRTDYKADALEYGRRIDAEAKRVTALLLEIENPLKIQKETYDIEQERIKKEAEEKEKLRVTAIIERIERIKNAPFKHGGKNSQELQKVIEIFESNILNENFNYENFNEQAKIAKDDTYFKLKEMLLQRKEAEFLAEERKKIEEEKAALAAEKAKLQPTKTQLEPPVNIEENLDIEEADTKESINSLESSLNRSIDYVNSAIANTSNTQQITVPIENPSYNELISIIKRLLKQYECVIHEDYIFRENVQRMLRNIEGV